MKGGSKAVALSPGTAVAERYNIEHKVPPAFGLAVVVMAFFPFLW